MRKFSTFIFGTLMGLVLSSPLLAAGHGTVMSDASPDARADTLALFPAPESVQVHVPPKLTTSHESSVTLFVTMPFGCYKTEVQVQHRDDHTHVLTPVLEPGDQTCVPISRYDIQKVDLGYLPPGEHQVIVSNALKPVAPVKFTVSDGDTLATH